MRKILLKAAEHIEQKPSDYCFMSVAIPSPGRRAGCALGWVAFFLGMRSKDSQKHPTPATSVAVTHLGVVDPSEFYDRMSSYNHGHRWGETWTTSAAICASALRAYADEFFPGE